MILSKEDVHTQHLLIKSFCKNTNTPINCYDKTIFIDLIKLLDPFLNTINKLNQFQEYIKSFNHIDDMFSYEQNIQDEILQKIYNNPLYSSFILENFQNKHNYINEVKHSFMQQNLYNVNNHGKIFLSIDLRQANFVALKHYSKQIFDINKEYDKWEDVVADFTPYEFLQNSKRLRQIILGKLNSKRIEQYETYIMSCLIIPFVKQINPYLDITNLISLKGDELIFHLPLSENEIETQIPMIKIIKQMVQEFLDISIHCNIFKLINIDGIDSGYLKLLYNGASNNTYYKTIEIKGVNSLLYSFVADDLINMFYKDIIFINEESKYYFYEQNTKVLSKMMEKPKYNILLSEEDKKGIMFL